MAANRILTKRELLERLDQRSRLRYGIPFDEVLFSDLIKDDLVWPSTRQANVGRRPVHVWGWKAYRRCLQIARLKAAGVVRRDAQRLFLFLKGYTFPASLVREPLLNEYTRHYKNAFSGVRSRHLDDFDEIPVNQKARLRRSLGEPDNVFKDAGINLADDVLILAIRSARQNPLMHLATSSASLKRSLRGDRMSDLVSRLFAGMLMPPSDYDAGQGMDDVAGLVMNAPEQAYIQARETFRMLDLVSEPVRAVLFPDSSDEAFRAAVKKVNHAVRHDSGLASQIFMSCLRRSLP